jgi:hypothetical protein
MCGSTSRHLERTIEDSVTMRSSLSLRHIRGRTGKIAQEQFVGAEQSADGSWVHKTVVRHHEDDLYREEISYPDGRTARHEERLSDHRGHGSDKPELHAKRDRVKAEMRAARESRKRLNDRRFAEWVSAAETEALERTGLPMTTEGRDRLLRGFRART